MFFHIFFFLVLNTLFRKHMGIIMDGRFVLEIVRFFYTTVFVTSIFSVQVFVYLFILKHTYDL